VTAPARIAVTVDDMVNRAIAFGLLLPPLREWALHLGRKDCAALLVFLAGNLVPAPPDPDTVDDLVNHAILTGRLPPSRREWALHLGRTDCAALQAFIAGQARVMAPAVPSGGTAADWGTA
jgi:phage I-like protein